MPALNNGSLDDRARRLYQLLESEIDLQVEQTDLAEEIVSRVARFSILNKQLHETRREIAQLTGVELT